MQGERRPDLPLDRKRATNCRMATYVYETIPKNSKQKPRRFEVEQKMSEPPLKTDPKTGLPVRRVIIGGSGWVTHGASILSMKVPRSRK